MRILCLGLVKVRALTDTDPRQLAILDYPIIQ